ncbi:MAG: glycosyltransferase [Phycisphaerales bacterium]|nr:glycosyltransferase [Phycisphaerales bacterium]
MRVLMLGWDFPPVVSGGVGTACQGLTRALAAAGTHVTLILPRCPDALLEHVELVDLGQTLHSVDQANAHPLPTSPAPAGHSAPGQAHTEPANDSANVEERPVARRSAYGLADVPQVDFVEIDARLWPYRRPGESFNVHAALLPGLAAEYAALGLPIGQVAQPHGGSDVPMAYLAPPPPPCFDELFNEVQRYAERAADAATGRAFDVIHAHDWMTFPAAQAISALTGKPFVAHVHSTEFDRSGHQIDQRIYDIERAGLEHAHRIIAVSYMTRRILMSRYGIPAEKIAVVYNAVALNGKARTASVQPRRIENGEKVVLFLGRITVQKGPEYFLAAARKVLDIYPNVRFVMAGSGDAIAQTMQLAEEMGIADKVVFTGFLDGDAVERVFRSADLYVMPSVSDPFGIASLEAISFDVPVLMSRQSGAAEILRHVLKVDFWDIDEMANKIVAVLRHPPLHAMLKKEASYEVRRLSWADAANSCLGVFAAAQRMVARSRNVRTATPAKSPQTASGLKNSV